MHPPARRTLAMSGVPEGFADFVPADHPSLSVQMFPDDHGASVYDFVFDKTGLRWKLWTDTIGDMQIPAGASFSEIIVPTKDSARWVHGCTWCTCCLRREGQEGGGAGAVQVAARRPALLRGWCGWCQ